MNKKKFTENTHLIYFILGILITSCNTSTTAPLKESIGALDLKRGEVISCGPADQQLGTLTFEISCSKVTDDFHLALKFLHSFEYDEAEKVFAKIIDEQPDCAMAYWGIAMSNFHPLWAPPAAAELKKGNKAIEIARSITQKSKKEAAYIEAIAAFYNDWEKLDHRTRCLSFENAMEQLKNVYPDDKEAAIFYALSLNAAADPADKTFTRQKKAGAVLNNLYPGEPDHPGIVHYLIHTFDSPELAASALFAARKYASVAPSSAHALHMPSHVFTRLGLWDECISSNLASMSSAQCYAQSAGMKGHWDEELHAMDYLMYGYLQKGDNAMAKKQWDYLNTIKVIHPLNFKVAYAFASIPSRYLLENKKWSEAARLPVNENIPWENFLWQKAIIHFSRLMGAVQNGELAKAKSELIELNDIHNKLLEQKDPYKANQVQIQIKTSQAWILFKEGKNKEALTAMHMAAEMEDKTEKHPVTPGEVIPARELLGDMLMHLNQPGKALLAYEDNLVKHPNRFNGLYGAALAAEKSNNREKASQYYRQLVNISDSLTNRPELVNAKMYLTAKL